MGCLHHDAMCDAGIALVAVVVAWAACIMMQCVMHRTCGWGGCKGCLHHDAMCDEGIALVAVVVAWAACIMNHDAMCDEGIALVATERLFATLRQPQFIVAYSYMI